jgi:hypothetical protein
MNHFTNSNNVLCPYTLEILSTFNAPLSTLHQTVIFINDNKDIELNGEKYDGVPFEAMLKINTGYD